MFRNKKALPVLTAPRAEEQVSDHREAHQKVQRYFDLLTFLFGERIKRSNLKFEVAIDPFKTMEKVKPYVVYDENDKAAEEDAFFIVQHQPLTF